MQVIGAGVGRTGTYSLKLAINELGLGPCHHMEAVLHQMDPQVALWRDALAEKPNWHAIYDGFASAVDWPTARFFRELNATYPEARFVLTDRDPGTWADSFGATIYRLLGTRQEAPAEMRDWLDMAHEVVLQTGFPPGLARAELAARFEAHNAAVKAAIPADRLLVYQVRQGWAPLCDFLGVPAPDMAFPRTNDRAEFWDRVTGKI